MWSLILGTETEAVSVPRSVRADTTCFWHLHPRSPKLLTVCAALQSIVEACPALLQCHVAIVTMHQPEWEEKGTVRQRVSLRTGVLPSLRTPSPRGSSGLVVGEKSPPVEGEPRWEKHFSSLAASHANWSPSLR